MEFLELARNRFSVRNFLDKKVEKEKIDKILETAHVAPTAANRQPVRLLVLQSEEALSKVEKGAKTYGAPLIILVCCELNKAWVRPYDGKTTVDIDASILTDHMMMEATDLGLGSLWICHFNHKIMKEEFEIPDDVELVNILAIGYAAGVVSDSNRHSVRRIPIDELVFYETFK